MLKQMLFNFLKKKKLNYFSVLFLYLFLFLYSIENKINVFFE